MQLKIIQMFINIYYILLKEHNQEISVTKWAWLKEERLPDKQYLSQIVSACIPD